MANTAKDRSEIQTVSISKRELPEGTPTRDMSAPCLSRPKLWLGARSPFGLALPDAQPSATTTYAPRGVWLDDERLIVCDSGNHRVLIWNQVPTSDETPADVVLGQPDFESEGPAAGGRGAENGMHLPTGVIVVDGKLLVGDAWHHRVLVWNSIPTTSDTPPDYAIGQQDLTEVKVNRGGAASRQSMYWPYGIAFLEGGLCVADTGNRRVLIWDGVPTSDRPADILLGQPTETSTEENRGGPVAADSFRWPHDFATCGDAFFVADAGNHRILGWKTHLMSDRAADIVIGQKDFCTAYELPYDAQGSQRLRFPYAIASCGPLLAAADTANNRVLFWRVPLDDDVCAAAADVVGQFNFASNGENRWESVSDDTLCWPYGMSFHNGTLAIADSGNNRVMLWDCQPLIESITSE